MELALQTDGTLATLRVVGSVSMGETNALSEYLRVARENGAVRCLLDMADCAELPTTIVAILTREAQRFATAGGALVLSGVRDQNPFLAEAVAAGRFEHYRSLEEARATEKLRAAQAIDGPPPLT